MSKQNGKEARALVREFDKKLLAARDYDSWVYKAPFCFMEIVYVLLAFISDKKIMFCVAILGYAYSIIMEMREYLKFQGQSVYKVLYYYPVKKWDILCVRCGYLKDKLIKRFLLLYFIQIPWIFYQKGVTQDNIMIPIVLVLTALFFGVMDIFLE